KGSHVEPAIHDEQAAIVRRMYEDVITTGTNAIARKLNRDGIKTALGREWTANAVLHIVTSPIYKGQHISGKKKTIDLGGRTGVIVDAAPDDLIVARWPAIVTEDVWNRAQQALKRRQHGKAREQKAKFLLSGLLSCPECSEKLMGWAPKGRVARYVCSG